MNEVAYLKTVRLFQAVHRTDVQINILRSDYMLHYGFHCDLIGLNRLILLYHTIYLERIQIYAQ